MEPSLARDMAAACAGKRFEGTFKKNGNPSSLRRKLISYAAQCETLVTIANLYYELLVHMIATSAANPGMSWRSLWKETSMQGFDVRKMRNTDYGNLEYTSVIWLFVYLDHRVYGKLVEFNQSFEAITVKPHHLSETSLDRMGDTIEILMAALRAEPIGESLPSLQCFVANRETPRLFATFCQVVQVIHELDARFHTKVVKYSKLYVPGRMHLQTGCPKVIVDFGEKWSLAYEQTYVQWRGYCLYELTMMV